VLLDILRAVFMTDQRGIHGYIAPGPGCVGGARGDEVGVNVKEIVLIGKRFWCMKRVLRVNYCAEGGPFPGNCVNWLNKKKYLCK